MAVRFWRFGILLATAVLTASISGLHSAARALFDDDPLNEDPETQDASGVKEIDLSDQYDFVENSFLHHGDKTSQRAVNVNTADHVPNSSW